MDMALVLALAVLIVVGFVYIVRPGKDKGDVVEPSTPAPAQPTAEDLPTRSSLMRLKKEDLEALALDRGVQHTGTKSEIISRLLP
jgi:hypothetical protein